MGQAPPSLLMCSADCLRDPSRSPSACSPPAPRTQRKQEAGCPQYLPSCVYPPNSRGPAGIVVRLQQQLKLREIRDHDWRSSGGPQKQACRRMLCPGPPADPGQLREQGGRGLHHRRGNPPGAGAVHAVADAHVVGGDGFGDGACCTSDPASPPLPPHHRHRPHHPCDMPAAPRREAVTGRAQGAAREGAAAVGLHAAPSRPHRKNQRATSWPAPISAITP